MVLLSDSRYTDYNPPPPVYSVQLSANESRGHYAGSSASNRIHPGRQGRTTALRIATIDYGGQEQISRTKDLLSLIARLVKGYNHRIPSWTDFNIKFHSHKPDMQDVVGYLPTTNASVTQ